MPAQPGEVRIGYSGMANIAVVGTAAPAALTTAWAAAWKDLGLISEDGLTEGFDQNRTEIMAWGYDAPIRTQVSRKVTTFQVTFLETNGYVLSLFYSTPHASMSIVGTGQDTALSFVQGQNTAPDVRALGLDIIDGTRRFRYVIPRCEVTARGDVVYKGDVAVGYQMTFTALLASDGTTMSRSYGGVALPV